ncbi:MAG: hypothetical protein HY896_02225 [Deltaproteobacteria bacterium]|nr:hypothetical protein [Deltaproteobacteria bacterium]
MRKKSFNTVLFSLAAIVLATFPASVLGATYLYPWDTGSSVSIVDADPPGSPTNTGNDITKAWYAYGTEGSTGYHYFRMDLSGVPTSANAWNMYGMYIDSKPGGATSADIHIPFADGVIPPAAGIDMIIFSFIRGGAASGMALQWDEGLVAWKLVNFQYSPDANLLAQNSMNGGKTLEWRFLDYPSSDWRYINTPFSFWGGIMLAPGIAPVKTTYDVTGQVVTPIPNAAWLMGAGIIALVGLKRRKPRQ